MVLCLRHWRKEKSVKVSKNFRHLVIQKYSKNCILKLDIFLHDTNMEE